MYSFTVCSDGLWISDQIPVDVTTAGGSWALSAAFMFTGLVIAFAFSPFEMLRKKEGGDLKLPLQIAAAESTHTDRAVY